MILERASAKRPADLGTGLFNCVLGVAYLFLVRRAGLNTTVKAHWISEAVELVEKLDNFLFFSFLIFLDLPQLRTRKKGA